MRSFIGIILLIIVISMLVITVFYQWNTNATIEFSIRNPEDPLVTTSHYNIKIKSSTPQNPPKQSSQPATSDDPYTIQEGVMPVQPQPKNNNQPITTNSIPVAQPLPESEPTEN